MTVVALGDGDGFQSESCASSACHVDAVVQPTAPASVISAKLMVSAPPCFSAEVDAMLADLRSRLLLAASRHGARIADLGDDAASMHVVGTGSPRGGVAERDSMLSVDGARPSVCFPLRLPASSGAHRRSPIHSGHCLAAVEHRHSPRQPNAMGSAPTSEVSATPTASGSRRQLNSDKFHSVEEFGSGYLTVPVPRSLYQSVGSARSAGSSVLRMRGLVTDRYQRQDAREGKRFERTKLEEMWHDSYKARSGSVSIAFEVSVGLMVQNLQVAVQGLAAHVSGMPNV